jgi:hypothetical protein
MATVQNVINRAIARSEQNEADLIASADMVNIVSDAQRSVYLLAAQEAPNFFGDDTTLTARTAFGDSWDISTLGVGVITQVEIAAITGTVTGLAVGDKINLIDLRFPELEATPRAYVRNRKITGYSTDLGAADANMVTQLKLFYSPVPAALPATTSTISLPDQWIELLALPLARKLAMADGGRTDEVQGLEAEMATELARFITTISTFDYTAVRPVTARSPIQTLGITQQQEG